MTDSSCKLDTLQTYLETTFSQPQLRNEILYPQTHFASYKHRNMYSPPHMKNEGELKIAHLGSLRGVICSPLEQHEFAHTVKLSA